MSQKTERPQLIIELDRDWVRVFFVESHQIREAASLAGIEGLRGKSAYVLLSRKLTLARLISLPEAAKADTLSALKMRLVDIFPIPAKELAFDFIPTPNRDDQGRICQVFAAKTSDINLTIASAEEQGINILKMLPAQAPVYSMALKDGNANAIYAERFGDLVNLDLIQDKKLSISRMVPVSMADQEFARLHAQSNPGTSLFVEGVTFGQNEQRLGQYTIGRVAEFDIPVDLEPESHRTQRAEKANAKYQNWALIMCLLGIVIAASTYFDYVDRSAKVDKETKKFNNRMKISKLKAETSEKEVSLLKPKSDQLKLAYQPAQRMADILKVAVGAVPKDAWLTGVTLERGKPISLRGTAKNSEAVSTYMKELTKQSRFRDVRLLFANSGDIEDTSVVQFSITAFPVGNLPIVEVGKKRK